MDDHEADTIIDMVSQSLRDCAERVAALQIELSFKPIEELKEKNQIIWMIIKYKNEQSKDFLEFAAAATNVLMPMPYGQGRDGGDIMQKTMFSRLYVQNMASARIIKELGFDK